MSGRYPTGTICSKHDRIEDLANDIMRLASDAKADGVRMEEALHERRDEVKELNDKIRQLEKDNAKLEQRIAELENDIAYAESNK